MTIFSISSSSQFKKDYKRAMKRNLDIGRLDIVIELLMQTGMLPAKYKTHPLKGNYRNFFEAHITPDWLIIWHKQDNNITLVRTGSHSDLF